MKYLYLRDGFDLQNSSRLLQNFWLMLDDALENGYLMKILIILLLLAILLITCLGREIIAFAKF